MLLVSLCLGVCRLALFVVGWEESIGDLSAKLLSAFLLLGLEFDVAAALVANTPWMLLALVPVVRRRGAVVLKSLFVLTNGLLLFVSLCDVAFFRYANRRLSVLMLKEFAGETNLHTIFMAELAGSWQLVLLFALMVAALTIGYRKVRTACTALNAVGWLLLAAATVLSCLGRRVANPADTLNEAFVMRRVAHNRQVDFAVNTPFKIWFSAHRPEIVIRDRFSRDELDAIMPIMHRPDSGRAVSKRNVMVIIVESLSQQLMTDSLAPFLDSLCHESTRFTRSYANGSISIDALPSIFSSIPRVGTPYVLTHNDNSRIPSLARELRSWGYSTAFFHGGNNATMGFQAFARSIGFERYLGRDEYNADSRFHGDDDFDGTWAVWDEPFLQFTALQMGRLRQPFLVGVFTATSHHPYAVPRGFAHAVPHTPMGRVGQAVGYTDFALRRFFETARRQPWYANTLFVITADHTNPMSRKRGRRRRHSDLGRIEIPIFVFDPSKEVEPGLHEGIVQQIDIMPTVLHLLGYDRPFVALGKNAMRQDSASWAFHCDPLPLYIDMRQSRPRSPHARRMADAILQQYKVLTGR